MYRRMKDVLYASYQPKFCDSIRSSDKSSSYRRYNGIKLVAAQEVAALVAVAVAVAAMATGGDYQLVDKTDMT
jgi:hypothetical protein